MLNDGGLGQFNGVSLVCHVPVSVPPHTPMVDHALAPKANGNTAPKNGTHAPRKQCTPWVSCCAQIVKLAGALGLHMPHITPLCPYIPSMHRSYGCFACTHACTYRRERAPWPMRSPHPPRPPRIAAMTVASSPLNTASMSCMSAGSRSACWPCSMPAECRDREEERPEGGWAMGAEKRDEGEGPEVDGTMERMCLGDSQ